MLFQFLADEVQQVLLGHTPGVVHVRVHLAACGDVAKRHVFLLLQLLVGIQQGVDVEARFQEGKALVGVGLDRAGVDNRANLFGRKDQDYTVRGVTMVESACGTSVITQMISA